MKLLLAVTVSLCFRCIGRLLCGSRLPTLVFCVAGQYFAGYLFGITFRWSHFLLADLKS